jgi:radical SAM superfamily enzyme YgiQ (UPF0313 family)
VSNSIRSLLVFPEFDSQSFWNYRATCELTGAAYPAAPLGMVTVAALLPEDWECRLIDQNVETLCDGDLEWADIVLTGSMIAQQRSCLELIQRVKDRGKIVVVGGPDATSSPHIYGQADHLVLGEGEITIPRWLADFRSGTARHTYECGGEFADLASSPLPRFELLRFDRYLHVGIQFGRGCPFNCEFCDIIELFGRVPRLKTADQMLREIQRLYDLGYRGHIDFVDDNLVGNKRDLKILLQRLRSWLDEHQWPFEFSAEASANLADDDGLLQMMQDVGFAVVFVGIENPDEETLMAMQKTMNTRRNLAESLLKIYQYGMFVNTGYIIGFDHERETVAQDVLDLIETSDVPVNMVGLLFALPNTQLARRLAREGRLPEDFAVAPEGKGGQCTGGLNFVTERPRSDILRDYRRIIDESYEPRAYFGRVLRVCAALNCCAKKLRLPKRLVLKNLRSFGRLIWRMGIRRRYRFRFWETLILVALRNPRALRYAVVLMALYLHFGDFRVFLREGLDEQIAQELGTS